MVDFLPILEALRSIPNIQDSIIQYFEDTFRSNYSSLDLSLLLNGHVPQSQISTLLTSTLEQTAQHSLDLFDQTKDQKYSDIANMLWNPLTATLFKVVSTSAVTVKEEKPAVRLPKANVSKVKPVQNPVSLPETQIESIKLRLKDIRLQKTHLYQTPGHTHVKCEKPNCEFCLHLFNNLNITKCEGHKRCATVGWYPHVGPALWQMLRKKHSNGVKPTIQPKLCKPYEIPALTVDEGVTLPVSPMDSEFQSHDEDSSFSTPVPSPLRRPRSPSWADDMPEDLELHYLNRRKVKPASTTC